MSTDWLCDPRLLTPEKLEVYQDTVREKCGDVIADEMLGHLAAIEAFLDKMRRIPYGALRSITPRSVIIATPTGVSIPLHDQGARSKEYSAAVESRWRAAPTEVFGISTDVHLKCAYPMKFLGAAADAHIHHNNLYSRVTELESRHYPGNDPSPMQH